MYERYSLKQKVLKWKRVRFRLPPFRTSEIRFLNALRTYADFSILDRYGYSLKLELTGAVTLLQPPVIGIRIN